MKLELFNPVPYQALPRGSGWPLAASSFRPDAGLESYEAAFRVFEAAHAAGFDSLNVAEHHYSTSLTPNPIVFAAALSQRLPEARIGVLGVDIPLNNPVRVAEEFAMLDLLLGGRLTAIGLLRGTPNEYLTYGSNPYESKEATEEAVRLIIRAFTEPEPFGWLGRYYSYRTVSVWPRPYQQPYPRLLLSANSEASVRFAARVGADIGFSFQMIEGCARNAEIYREEAARCGWEPTPDNILYRQNAYVAATDEQAQQEFAQHFEGLANAFSPKRQESEVAGAIRLAADAMGGMNSRVLGRAGGEGRVGGEKKHNPVLSFNPPFVGSPETVHELIRDAEQRIGIGRMELSIPGKADSVIACLELIGRELTPKLHADAAVPTR